MVTAPHNKCGSYCRSSGRSRSRLHRRRDALVGAEFVQLGDPLSEIALLGLLPSQRERAAIGRERVFGAREAPAEVGARRVDREVVVELSLGEQALDELEPL